jgi:hypothetical protein
MSLPVVVLRRRENPFSTWKLTYFSIQGKQMYTIVLMHLPMHYASSNSFFFFFSRIAVKEDNAPNFVRCTSRLSF